MLLAYSDRPMDNNTTFTTGGDVSRFQRRTVPGKPEAMGEQMASAMAGLGKGLASALTGKGGAAAPIPAGPVVRVARGNDVTVVPVGAR
jgi:pilus assembly protein CpaB